MYAPAQKHIHIHNIIIITRDEVSAQEHSRLSGLQRVWHRLLFNKTAKKTGATLTRISNDRSDNPIHCMGKGISYQNIIHILCQMHLFQDHFEYSTPLAFQVPTMQ